MTHEELMNEAIKLSIEKMQAGDGGPFGAVIARDGKIVGRGWNKVTSTNDPTAHAEVEAIRDACKNLGNFELLDCVLYTSCEPCPMCLSALYWARIPVFYYGNTRADAAAIAFDDDFIYTEIPKDHGQRRVKAFQLGAPKAAEAFRLWKQKTDKIEY